MKPRIIMAKLVLAIALCTVLSACTHLFQTEHARVPDPKFEPPPRCAVGRRHACTDGISGEEEGPFLFHRMPNIGTHVKLDLCWLTRATISASLTRDAGGGAPEVTGIHLDAGAALKRSWH
jgi:hypothetical protein